MLREKKYHLFLIIALLSCHVLVAQQAVSENSIASVSNAETETGISVGQIIITGNKKTKAFIVLRELPFKTGDQYPLDVLIKKMETARKQLMNTALFHLVIVSAKNIKDNTIDIAVDLKERWYLFPLPFFRPVDRNFNQWLVEHKGSLDRVNYGAKLSYNNATGRNDKIRLGVTNGYTKQLSFSYDRPYIDYTLKWGLKFSFAAGKNREINYNTIADKQVFLKDDNQYVRNFITGNIEFSYRRAIKTKHSFGIGYTSERVKDTIAILNPSYFKSGRKNISFPGIYYTLNYLNLDYNPYPNRGYAAQISIAKSGLNNSFNIWQLHVKGLGVWPVAKKVFFSLSAYGGLKLPFKQPYFTQRFLGYGDVFMQGYEYNVIDGVAGGYVKTTLTRELLNFAVKTPAVKKGKVQNKIPVRIFGKIYGNAGYVHSPDSGENSLSNKMLYSGGFGIDILTFYDVIFKLEWSLNSAGQNGIFFHQKSTF